MAAKPTDLPNWATDNDYPAGPNGWNATPTKVEPIGGKQAEGFEPIEKPPAQYLNWYMNLVYLWALYLSDGALSGDHSIDGDLKLKGSLTFTGVAAVALAASSNSLDPMGDGTTNGLHTINVTADTDLAWSIGGLQGGVEGREIDIVNVGANAFFVGNETGGATAVERVTFPAHIVAESQSVMLRLGGLVRLRYSTIGGNARWRVIAMVGCLHLRRIRIPPAAAEVTCGAGDVTHMIGTSRASGGHILVDIQLAARFPIVGFPAGARIAEWTLFLKKTSDATKTLAAGLRKVLGDDHAVVNLGADGAGVTDTTAANNPGYTAIGDSGFNEVIDPIADSAQYYLEFTHSAPTVADEILHADVAAWAPV